MLEEISLVQMFDVWIRGKLIAVTSLYANVFGYINTQFVKSINILGIEDADGSLIIHPFFEDGL